MADVTARMLALLTELQTGRAFAGSELADRLAVSPRTLRRDIDRLRGYGYPVDTQPGPGGFYRLAPGSRLPPLLFDDDEVVATLVGLAVLAAATDGAGTDATADGLDDSAARAFAKIDQVLPPRLRANAERVRASVEAGSTAAPKVAPAALATIAEAVSARAVLRFAYADASGRSTERLVEPARQVHLHLRWYLVGWDRSRHDWRTFRLDRITALTTTSGRFEQRPLPADTALELVRRGVATGRRRATVVVDADRQAVLDALRYQAFDVIASSATQTTRAIDVATWHWLVLELAALEAPFAVVAPDELRRACADFAELLRAGTTGTAR